MKLVNCLILSTAILAGCTTVPVVVKFPQAPESLLAKCPALTTIANNDDTSIIDLTKIVTQNYTTYYECSTKIEGWIEWYNSQKKIFDEVSE